MALIGRNERKWLFADERGVGERGWVGKVGKSLKLLYKIYIT